MSNSTSFESPSATTSTSTVSTGQQEAVVDYVPASAILDGKFFSVVEVDASGVKVKAVCNNCVRKTIIAGSTNALSNFVTHLKVNVTVVLLLISGVEL